MFRAALVSLLLLTVSTVTVSAQTIELMVDQSQSNATASALGTSDTSSITGSGEIVLTPTQEPFETAHVVDLDLSLADGFLLDTGLVDVIVEPDGAMVFFVQIGPPGDVDSNNQFDQLGNVFGISGMAFIDLLVGQDQTVDLATVKPVVFDIVDSQLSVDGTTLTIETLIDLDFEFEVLGMTATMNLNGPVVLTGELPAGIIGDVNCDGVVNLLDVAPFVDAITNGSDSFKADINGDGSVDLLDVTPFVALLAG